MLPSRRLVIMLLAVSPLFLAGSLYGICTGLAVLYLLLLAFYIVIDILVLPSKKRLKIERIIPERISLGYPTRIVFEVHNISRRQLNVEIAENFEFHMQSDPIMCKITLKPGQRKEVDYRLTAHQRGEYELGEIFVRFIPVMGLIYRRFKRNLPCKLKIFPRLSDIKRYELLTRRGLNYGHGMARIRRVGQGSEFESLRQYIIGDEISKIDWKATAKRDKIIIKNYETEKQQSVIVAIDIGRATAGEFEGYSRVEYLINATLMLAYVILRQKDWFSLIVFSDKIETYLPPVHGLKNIEKVVDTLYNIKPKLVESDYGAACRFLSLRNRKRSLFCLMTDVIDKDASSVILAYMARFARYHLPLTVTLANPEVIRLANEPLAVSKNIHDKAIALDVLAARRKALISMRRQGVSVLDVTPNELTCELINRYTLIKSRHML